MAFSLGLVAIPVVLVAFSEVFLAILISLVAIPILLRAISGIRQALIKTAQPECTG